MPMRDTRTKPSQTDRQSPAAERRRSMGATTKRAESEHAGAPCQVAAPKATMPAPDGTPDGPDASLVTVEGLSVTLGKRPVLSGIDASIARGEIVTVLGPNGSGKSTLLRAMLGILKPSAGCVQRRTGLVVGYVPQRLSLDPTMPMTVARFLDLPVRSGRAAREEVLGRVGLEGLAQRPMQALSGGQFQRALLARALLSNPDLLMLDEPTQGLDHAGAASFYRLIGDIRRKTGCAVLMISHDLHVVMAASDRVICLTDGEVCCEGAPERVASAPEYQALFGTGGEETLALYRHRDTPGSSHGDRSCSTIS